MSTHARPLAERLAAASDADLEALFRARRVSPDADWEDFFDAAEALLDAVSVERALARLTLAEATALRAAVQAPAAAGDAATLDALGLLDDDHRALGPVAAGATSLPSLPEQQQFSFTEASPSSAAKAAERAFTTVGALADLLLATRSAPLALVATGAVSATEKRRLADDGDLDDLRTLAESAGLVRAVGRELQITADAEPWLASSFAPRWARLVTAFRDTLPHGIRDGSGWLPPEAWAVAHPWDSAWPARADALTRLAKRLGLLTAEGDEPAWAAAVRGDDPAAADLLQAQLPTEVDRLFLQNDLTAIAPGPLQPTLDNRLRAMTEHESTSQASSYRFTADSVAAALVDGETEQSILDFLGEVSLTGVPQPLTYLVSQAAARHGLVRVGPDRAGGTVVSSTDAHLLSVIEIDRNLRPIGLLRDADRLLSRVGAETVAWALADARYPATLVDMDGHPVDAPRRRVAPDTDEPAPSYTALIGRLRLRQGPDADAAWLERELESAVRARAVVRVEVAMPDGSSRELTLEASGLGGGRLRGRDRAADVERTLPVRSIRSVQVVQA